LSRGCIYWFVGYVQDFLVGAGVLGIGLKNGARSVSVAMPRYSGEPTGSGQCPCRQAVKLSPGA